MPLTMIKSYTTNVPDHNLIEPSQDYEPEVLTCDGCGCDLIGEGWIEGNEIFCETCLNAEL